MYDAIVVGARCAGSPTAMLLARAGHRVLLLDRAKFPSDTLSVHYVHQPGVACLARWGLLDAVAATNCPPVLRQRLDVGPFALEGTPPPADGADAGYAPRRTVLDKLLVDAAAAAGAEVRERFTVDGLSFDGDRVVGVRGHAAGGAVVEERARVVVGADGQHSLVARSVRAPEYDARPVMTCAYYSYWDGVPLDRVELYLRPQRTIVAGPTNDGQTLVIVYWPLADFGAVRSDMEAHFMAALDLAPGLAERVRAGRRSEHFRGTADQRNFYRRPHGPGWALVGDAGYHKDPVTAQGITDAFRDADRLAEAIDAGFAGRRPLGDALADCEQRRDADTRPLYELTCQFAALAPPSPEMQQLLAALQGNQPQIDRFLGTVTGTTPIAEFFAPENVGRIFATAQAA